MADLMRILSRLVFALRQCGWQMQAGLALWIASCLLALWLVFALQKQRDLEANLAQPTQKTAIARTPQNQKNLTQRFYALLPNSSKINALSEQVLQAADSMGLQFEQAEFSDIKTTETALMQHQIKLPVRGNYVQVRQFLNGLLNAQPALALTEFAVRRDDVLTELVEANLVFTLYLRGDAK